MFGSKLTLAACLMALASLAIVQAEFTAPPCVPIPHGKASAKKYGKAIELKPIYNELTKTTDYQDADYNYYLSPMASRTVYQILASEEKRKSNYVYTIKLKNRSILQVPLSPSKTTICSSDIFLDPKNIESVFIHKTL